MIGALAQWLQGALTAASPVVPIVGAVCLLAPCAAALALRPRLAGRHWRGALVRRARRPGWGRAPDRSASAALTLAGLPINALDETKHFKLIGTTGTGKSTAISQLLRHALRRGDRALISDPEGAYLQRFYQRYRGDVLLNPFEANSAKWDLFGELQNDYDIEQLASALIPNSADAATQEWRAYARTFLSVLTRRCCQRGERDLEQLWRLLMLAPPSQLRALVAGTPAQAFLDPDNARMFASIRAVSAAAMAALDFIRPQRAAPLSMRQWVRGARGVLFIPYRAGQISALRSVIAAWIRLAIFEAMNHPEAGDQRLWFIVDELDALGVIDGLKDALARLRKFGGRCVLGLQSIAQVSATYGHGEAQTIVENCANTLILRCAGSENGGTSQFASRLIGEREVIRRQRTRGREAQALFHGRRRSWQVSEQHVLESAVLASELEQLPDLAGYLKLASRRHWIRIELPRQ